MLPIRKLFQTCAAILCIALPSAALAQCQGLNLWDSLSNDQRADIRTRDAATPFSDGNFWTATKGATTLTIAGTLHLPDPRHDETLILLRPALDTADLLLVEATLDDQREMQTYMSQNPDIMTLPDGVSLIDRLDPALWGNITEAAAARGLPGVMLARMQPWFVSMTLSVPPCAMSAMASGEAGIDNLLMQDALATGTPIAPLEPWQDTLAILSDGTFEKQLNTLRVSLAEPWVQDALTTAIIEFYFTGESAKSWYIMDALLPYLTDVDEALFDAEMADMQDKLLDSRNRNWIPVIEEAASQHDEILIAFGAAHLFGEVGVLNLLAQNGWTVAKLN